MISDTMHIMPIIAGARIGFCDFVTLSMHVATM